jgi:hypothetical protein
MTKLIPILIYIFIILFISAWMYYYPPNSAFGWFAFATGAVIVMITLLKGSVDTALYAFRTVRSP